ncbi:MAG: hypothetical protein ACFFD4_34975 [Candidatus Odinarchaeota archaeon]
MVIEKTGELVIKKFYYEHELRRSEKELKIRKNLDGKELWDRIRHHDDRELRKTVFITVLVDIIIYLWLYIYLGGFQNF